MTVLSLSWSKSRGREAYGQNICRLDDRDTGKRYRCMGGGYDMTGIVFGAWLEDRHQDRLRALVKQRSAELARYTGTTQHIPSLYGLIVHAAGSVHLNGACGMESMRSIAEAIGIDLEASYTKRGNLDMFYVSDLA